MNAREEYEILVKMSKTKQGWKKIDTAWNIVCDNKRTEGGWIQGSSKGRLIIGFGIDIKTKHIEFGNSVNHNSGFERVIDWIKTQENPKTPEHLREIHERPIKGWAGRILGFALPCILMADDRFVKNRQIIKEVEDAILDQNLGIPLTGIYFDKFS